VTQAKPDSRTNTVSETGDGEPPAKKPHLEDEHKTVKKVHLFFRWPVMAKY